MNKWPGEDDGTLDKLTELAKIPPGNHAGFGHCIRASVEELWRGMAAQQPPVRRKPILAALAEYQAAIQKTGELLSPNDGSQGRAAEYATSHIRASLSGMKKDRLAEFEDDVLLALGDLDRAIEKAKLRVAKAYKDKGRPPGAQNGQVAIDLFLFNITFTIREMGGIIATSRTQKSSPTYIGKALEILRPFLPGNFPASASLERKCETIGAKIIAQPTKKSAKNYVIKR